MNVFLYSNISIESTTGYLYTQQAQELVNELNKQCRPRSIHNKICLYGPKGVGKSATLLFLASACSKNWVFITTRSLDLKFSYVCLKEELQPPIQKRPKLSNESEDTCGQLSVPTLLETIGSLKEVILFVDLSEWSESSLDHKSLEKDFFIMLQACLRAIFPIVLASSSSRGGMTAPRYVQSLRTHVTPWMWKPFTLEETEKFKNKLHYKCGTVTAQQLFNITCGNPRFLLQCSHLTTLNIMSSEISEMVEHLVRQAVGGSREAAA